MIQVFSRHNWYIYGTSLRVPGAIGLVSDLTITPSTIFKNLRSNLKELLPPPTVFHGSANLYVPMSLLSCTFVWLRTDRTKTLLESPYEGPYRVIRRSQVFCS